MPLYNVFQSSGSGHELVPDVSSDVIAKFPEVRRAAPLIAALMAMNAWAVTDQPKFTWQSVDLRARTTQINNGGAAYTNATTDLVVDDASVFEKYCVILCEATGEYLYCTAVNLGTNTVTVKRAHGNAGGGGGAAAAAGSVADDAVLRNIGVAAASGSDKLPEVPLYDAKKENICQFFRKTVSQDGRLAASKTFTPDWFARQTALKLQELLRDAEHACMFGVYSDTQTDLDGKLVTTMKGIIPSAGNVINVAGNITQVLWNGYMRTVFAAGSEVRYCFGGLEALDYVLALYGSSAARRELDTQAGSVIETIRTQNGILKVVPHLGFTGARAKDLVLVDMDGAMPRLRHMGQNRFKTGPNGAPLDGKFQLLDNRQGTSEDLVTREILADLGLEWGEQSFTTQIKDIRGTA